MKMFYFIFAVTLFAFFSYQSPRAPARASVTLDDASIGEIAVSEDREIADDWLSAFEEEQGEIEVYRESEIEGAVLVL